MFWSMLLAIIFKHTQISEEYYKTLHLFHDGVLTPNFENFKFV